jgi:hypothetical protein
VAGAAGAGGGGGGGGGSSFFLQPAMVTVKAKNAPMDQKMILFPIFSPPFKSLPEKLRLDSFYRITSTTLQGTFGKNPDPPGAQFVPLRFVFSLYFDRCYPAHELRQSSG